MTVDTNINPLFIQVFINHTSCEPSSRCKKDKNYEPPRIILTDPVAEKLLVKVILKSNIFRYPQDYILGRDILYHFIAHANPYCKLLYSGEDFISWKNLCPIPICYI
jgi:hypothetical protein